MTSTIADERSARVAEQPFVQTGRLTGASGGLRAVTDIWGYRQLLGLLVRRELRARYKDSVLGFFWSLMRPLTMLAVYYVIVGQVLGARGVIPGYAIYVFAGLTAWTLFSDIIAGGTGSIVGNAGLVKKVYLPREVFPMSVVGSALFNFAIQTGILLVAIVALRVPPAPENLVYALASVALLVTLGLAMALVLASVNVFLRDVQYLVEIVLMVAMWACPIIYSYSLVAGSDMHGWLKDLYVSNPVALAVMSFQAAFWRQAPEGSFPDHLLLRTCVALLVSLVLLVVGHRVFVRLQGNFAQEL